MSDETRTVTAEDIERAIREVAPVVGGELQAGGIKHHVGLAHAIFAALPTSTEGLTAERMAAALHEMEGPGRHSRPRLTRQICPGPDHHIRDAEKVLASLSPSPTEDPA